MRACVCVYWGEGVGGEGGIKFDGPELVESVKKQSNRGSPAKGRGNCCSCIIKLRGSAANADGSEWLGWR